MFNRRRITAALIGLLVLVVGGWLVKDLVADGSGESGLPTSSLSSLPPEASETWKLIGSNGPFPYPRNDGAEFQNRERLLPARDPGYYREYTVKTPGSEDRGARRLITGAARELYYTGDHYASFVIVDPSR
ncbi:ribonuclease domain-containing protein [Amycolatopsis magusensis]|uniref:Guanyl-specific ribonuclease Sa n=1 Tax=Amycolatopsis magusensis TaxID=882444 RepID=A0ABS4PQ27_9PSEU|nr:ribonuclease domain-containing protein [Amycolatopsis magusensis]MBP2181525.1 guanyl-specific ribonuclease Sa [Amycolatopsis magusensis]MDI5979756.1 ribonuclease domain-containing protein [Amycolatopsis magusensis]